MKLNIVLPGFRTPNNANGRPHWRTVTKRKHEAQDALLSALRFAASTSSTLMQNTEASKIYSTAFVTLASYVATKRVKCVSKSTRLKSTTTSKKLSPST